MWSLPRQQGTWSSHLPDTVRPPSRRETLCYLHPTMRGPCWTRRSAAATARLASSAPGVTSTVPGLPQSDPLRPRQWLFEICRGPTVRFVSPLAMMLRSDSWNESAFLSSLRLGEKRGSCVPRMVRGDPKCDPKHYVKTAMYPDYQDSPHIYILDWMYIQTYTLSIFGYIFNYPSTFPKYLTVGLIPRAWITGRCFHYTPIGLCDTKFNGARCLSLNKLYNYYAGNGLILKGSILVSLELNHKFPGHFCTQAC